MRRTLPMIQSRQCGFPTSVSNRYPANEVRALYHERWEIELGFGEIKTDMLERLETIRSKTPTAVTQELWGLLIAYNLVRLEMQRIAAELDVAPIRISFVAALRVAVRCDGITRHDSRTPRQRNRPDAQLRAATTKARTCLSPGREDQNGPLNGVGNSTEDTER